MEHTTFQIDGALVVAMAVAAGVLAQSLARHLRIPGIVLLLATGAVLGPDVLNVVRPRLLGTGLQTLVGFAVSVILFEGGLNLHVRKLARQAKTIRRLVTVGALVTTVGGTLLARYLMGWDWQPAILFGTLVTVTGPTVITPLLRRVKVTSRLQTILEAEGVFIDAVGAILAVVALEVAVGTGETAAAGVLAFFARIGTGCAIGLVGGALMALLLRFEQVIPEGLENVFALSTVFVLFQFSNALQPESGIAAAAFAGLVVGNVRSRSLRDLMDFKEQLTVMLIGMLFVLLAADVRVEDVLALGRPGVLTVVGLMLVVRPLNILASTAGSDLTWQEKTFLSWLAPRGIVAAAVASLFAEALGREGVQGGTELRALVFLVIAVTVLVQGLSGGLVARLLGVRRPSDRGWVVLGGGGLGMALGQALGEDGEEVVLVDSNPTTVKVAEDAGFRVVWGNALEESTLQRTGADSRAGVLAVTPNEEVNLLFARRTREAFDVPRSYVALRSAREGVSPELVKEARSTILFGAPRELGLWDTRLRRDRATIERWRLDDDELTEDDFHLRPDPLREMLLPLAYQRRRRPEPVDERTRFSRGSVVAFAVMEASAGEAHAWLEEHGWAREPGDGPESGEERDAEDGAAAGMGTGGAGGRETSS